MRSKNPKPSSKFVVSASSEESSSSDRTIDDSVVIGTVTADNPFVSSGRDVGLHAGDETGQFFNFVAVLAEPKPKVVADTSSLFDIVSREGSELNKVLGELGIRREKRLNSFSVAWKSAAEVLKLAAANRVKLVRQHDAEKAALEEQFEQEKREQFEKEVAAIKQEVEDKAKKVVDIAVTSRNKLIQALYIWGLSREDVDLALAGKYGEIVFLGDDASPVAEQTPAPPVDDDPTKEEVVHLRGKVIKMEKTLSRARDSINRTQQVHNKLEYERRLHKLKFDKTFKELLELQCRYGKIKIERDEVLRKETDRLLQNSEMRVKLLEARLLDTQQRLQVSQSRLKKKITPKQGKRAADMDHERQMADVIAFYGTELERVENEFRRYISSCGKDVEVENDKWKESLKKKKSETMAANQQVLDLLSMIEKQKNDLLYHQSVIANNTDLLKKQDSEIHYMRERLKKLNWDLREARDSCQRKNDRAKIHEEACSKRDRELNEAINKCNLWIPALDRDKQALVQECIQGNEVFEELYAKYKESQMMMDAAEAEINYSREEKKSLEARCKDLDDELNRVKTKFYEATLLTAENVTLRVMAMLHADVEKFRIERESILAATTEYVMEYDLQLARLFYIDNLMPRVRELLNAPSTVVDAAIPSPALLLSGLGESSNVDCPKREQ
ncbi:hypothetical protein GIB67_040608 [Kingdonia uniflora]|uniref:Uncharacterized protein n=1 Tax=Kingdonia uniflora TaxID=39325 RepID=A0A7J7M8X5_9MAGN|nr:hypothetical protein GIB67_040608 [Kingdonia uniflora]